MRAAGGALESALLPGLQVIRAHQPLRLGGHALLARRGRIVALAPAATAGRASRTASSLNSLVKRLSLGHGHLLASGEALQF